MLAHKAEDEGMAVAEIIAGQGRARELRRHPGRGLHRCPEVATVGKTEEELKAAGIAYKVGKFPFTANGRARPTAPPRASSRCWPTPRPTACSASHIIGAGAGDLIHEVCRADGVRRLLGRPRPHLPRASHDDRSGEGSRLGGREAGHSSGPAAGPRTGAGAPSRLRAVGPLAVATSTAPFPGTAKPGRDPTSQVGPGQPFGLPGKR